MTAYWATDWRFSDRARAELKKFNFPQPVIAELEIELNDMNSFLSASPPSRRKQVADLKKLRARFSDLNAIFAEIDGLTADQMEAYAWGKGPGRTTIRFKEFKRTVAAYMSAAQRAEAALSKKGPRAGPDPEQARMAASKVKQIFDLNNLPTGPKNSDAFVGVLEIVFDLMGIAKGEARKHAKLVLLESY